MKGKPVMTPEQRKKAKAERDKRYKQRQRTEAAKLRAQKNKDFAKVIISAPRTVKGSKLAVKERLSALQDENRKLRAELKEHTKKKAASSNHGNIKVSKTRAELFNDAWRMLDYLSRHSNRLRSYRDES